MGLPSLVHPASLVSHPCRRDLQCQEGPSLREGPRSLGARLDPEVLVRRRCPCQLLAPGAPLSPLCLRSQVGPGVLGNQVGPGNLDLPLVQLFLPVLFLLWVPLDQPVLGIPRFPEVPILLSVQHCLRPHGRPSIQEVQESPLSRGSRGFLHCPVPPLVLEDRSLPAPPVDQISRRGLEDQGNRGGPCCLVVLVDLVALGYPAGHLSLEVLAFLAAPVIQCYCWG